MNPIFSAWLMFASEYVAAENRHTYITLAPLHYCRQSVLHAFLHACALVIPINFQGISEKGLAVMASWSLVQRPEKMVATTNTRVG